MTPNSSPELFIAYDYERWMYYGEKSAISIPVAPPINSSGLICGMSGSGKSYCELALLARLFSIFPDGEIFFSDYKQEFPFLRNCSHYFPYTKSLDALNIVYEIMQQRLLGKTSDFRQVTFIWDEYVSNILALQNDNRALAKEVMRKVSELLMLSRSLFMRIFIVTQRGDSEVFPLGSRLNFGFIIVLGTPSNSIYEMLVPDHIDQLQGMSFQTGEGILLHQAQGAILHLIKVPMARDITQLQKLCIKALS